MSEDNFQPLVCNENDVIAFGENTFKIGFFTKNLEDFYIETIEKNHSYFVSSFGSFPLIKKHKWLVADFSIDVVVSQSGISCEILRLGSQKWQEGKLKIKVHGDICRTEASKNSIAVSLYFCPDKPEISEPESPLDDIRRQMNQS